MPDCSRDWRKSLSFAGSNPPFSSSRNLHYPLESFQNTLSTPLDRASIGLPTRSSDMAETFIRNVDVAQPMAIRVSGGPPLLLDPPVEPQITHDLLAAAFYR